jgi:polar amino acid transport system permease protein
MTTFDWELAGEILPTILKGLWVTGQAVVVGMSLAIVLGLVWAILRRSPQRPISWAASAVVEFIRSTPLLVQLYLLFYIAPDIGIKLSPFVAGAIGLGLHYSAYTAEVYRAGIDGVPMGQWQAATALNMSRYHTLKRIILPQAIPPVIPVLGNYLVAMFKDAPLLSAITVVGVLQTAKIIGAERFRYLEPITIVGLLFLVVSLCSAVFIQKLETALMKDERR